MFETTNQYIYNVIHMLINACVNWLNSFKYDEYGKPSSKFYIGPAWDLASILGAALSCIL